MSGPVPVLRSDHDFLLPILSSSARVIVEETGSRFLLDLTVEIPGRPDILFTSTPKLKLKPHIIPLQVVKRNQWHRIELPARPDATTARRQSLFVRINRAVMAVE